MIKNKQCIECKWFQSDAGVPAASRMPAQCCSPHLIVVGDGVEGGSPRAFCWRERLVDDPTKYSFHCGPEALFFEPKES